MSKQTLVMDSSQLATYLECPTLWGYGYKDSISRIDAPPSDPISMGTYIHKLLEIYYKGIAHGYGMSACIEQALNFNPDLETCTCGHARENHFILPELDPLNCNESSCSCTMFIPKAFPLDITQRKLVKDRFTVHCYTYSKGDFLPLSPDHVEVGFSHKLYEDDEKLYVLEGRIDVLGTFSGVTGAIMDHKAQLRKRDLYKKAMQFRNYSLVTGASLLIINYVRLTKEVTKDTYSRVVANFSPLEQEWWRGELIKLYDKILRERQQPLEQRWDSCSGKFGYECQFTPLCEEFNSGVREVKKQMLYHPKAVWRPW